MTTQERCWQVVELLKSLGCRELVVCAGARNAPLVMAFFSQENHFKIWSHFDERAAGFFALGRIKSIQQPVAVVTTSGTAVAELLPATVEAHYAGLPFLLLSADRPQRFRGQGAPQAIEQVGIFSHYVEETLDVEAAPLAQFAWTMQRPLHINVCLEEPTREDVKVLLAGIEKVTENAQRSLANFKVESEGPSAQEVDLELEKVSEFFKKAKRPAVVLGPLNIQESAFVEEFLLKLGLPFVAESLSQLAGNVRLQTQQIRGGEGSLNLALKKGWVDGILRIGGVPTLRTWRDLEGTFNKTPVLVASRLHFSGLSRKDVAVVSLPALFEANLKALETKNGDWLIIQEKAQANCKILLQSYPQSEPALLAKLAENLPRQAKIYLGNSLPIREWDLVAHSCTHDWQIEGNRGANGIDGQFATYLGFASPHISNWAVLGDLTALYDLSAPWLIPQLSVKELNLVVVNNGGGQIFSRMFGQEELENRHQFEFSHWAKMWNLKYELWESIPQEVAGQGARVIELRPQNEQTSKFWNEWDTFWAQI